MKINSPTCTPSPSEGVTRAQRSYPMRLAPRVPEDGGADQNAVNREGRESAAADPGHEPGDHAQRDDERDDEADAERDPIFARHRFWREDLGGVGFAGLER